VVKSFRNLSIIFCIFALAHTAFAQPGEQSEIFGRTPDSKEAEILGDFQLETSPASLASQSTLLHAIESSPFDDRDYAFDQIFSVGDFERSHLVLAQNRLRSAIENETDSSVKRGEALLLSSLELLSREPIAKENIREADKQLHKIAPSAFTSSPVAGAEYYFWLGEILRSEHDTYGAIEAYSSAIEKKQDYGLPALAAFRRAELYEYQLRYIPAAAEFDSIASRPGIFRLLASLRRASLLQSMRNYSEELLELSRAEMITADSSNRTYSSSGKHPVNSHFEKYLPIDSVMLTSDYYREEISLLRGAAYSNLKQYDSAEYYFAKAERSLNQIKDSVQRNDEKLYLLHAITFERAWVKLSTGDNQSAARMFSRLAREDTSAHISFTGAASNNSGNFYHDEPVGAASIASFTTDARLDTTYFIYDDYPERSRYYAGIALSRAGEVEKARDILTNLSQDPSALYSDKARYNLALVEFRSGRSLQAEGLLTPIALRRTQSGVFASILLGDIHYRRNSYAKAAEYFGFALANLPDNDTTLRSVASLERGLSLLPLGSWRESAENLKLYVSLASANTPGLDEALFWLGRAYFRADSLPQARNCFKRVIDEFLKTDRLIDAQYGYAWTLFSNGEYKSADREFAKVIEMDSITKYAYDALSRRGDANYAGGDLHHALAIYNLAIDRPTFNDYRTTRSLYQTGVLRMLSDSARSAMNAFRTIYTKFPKSDILDRAYYNYAVAAFAIKQNENADEAVRILSTKFKDSPFATKGLYLAAGENERNENFSAALADYRKIYSRYPSSEEFVPSMFGALAMLELLKRRPEAIILADTFLMQHPNALYTSRLVYRKGELQFNEEQFDKSQETYQEFLSRFPDDTLTPWAKLMLARSINTATSFERPRAILTELTQQYPDRDIASFAYLELANLAEDAEPRAGNEDWAHPAEYFMHAYDMKYFSSEAAPEAMYEYARYLSDKATNPHRGENQALAVSIYDELVNRYSAETTIGGKALLQAGVILLRESKHAAAIAHLEKLAEAQEGYEIAAEARLQLGQIYKGEGQFKKAAIEFTHARNDNTASINQLGRSYIGSAECYIASGDKKDARKDLAELLSTHGMYKKYRDSAKELLESITPKKKKKHK
jgi:tetratricopeptide (TPR) repeat protein